ncbi:unnamed protein product [Somion occarium]
MSDEVENDARIYRMRFAGLQGLERLDDTNEAVKPGARYVYGMAATIQWLEEFGHTLRDIITPGRYPQIEDIIDYIMSKAGDGVVCSGHIVECIPRAKVRVGREETRADDLFGAWVLCIGMNKDAQSMRWTQDRAKIEALENAFSGVNQDHIKLAWFLPSDRLQHIS